MTRETKIGLLVGLAFVIVIGILISDHLSNTNEPAGAPLRASVDNLRSSLGQQSDGDVAPPLRVPISINPTQPVPTAEELTRRTTTHPPITFVDPPTHPVQPTPPNGNTIDRLRDIAHQHNEDVIDPNNNNDSRLARSSENGDRGDNHNAQPPVDPVKPTMRSYQAQPGDSLSAIALKAYGSNSKANREAIIAANPTLAENRDLIVAGRSYIIPSLTAAPSTPGPTQPVKPTEATVIYTVKSHDTLWSIANAPGRFRRRRRHDQGNESGYIERLRPSTAQYETQTPRKNRGQSKRLISELFSFCILHSSFRVSYAQASPMSRRRGRHRRLPDAAAPAAAGAESPDRAAATIKLKRCTPGYGTSSCRSQESPPRRHCVIRSGSTT